MNPHPIHVRQLVRRPAGEVFAAFVNPQTLRKFWLTDASGPLSPGARVRWEFMVPGAEVQVAVTRFEAPRVLGFDWSGGIHVELHFEDFDRDVTTVTVELGGMRGTDVLGQAADLVEGFSIVLCDLKTLLETGESAGLVADKAALITREMGAHRG